MPTTLSKDQNPAIYMELINPLTKLLDAIETPIFIIQEKLDENGIIYYQLDLESNVALIQLLDTIFPDNTLPVLDKLHILWLEIIIPQLKADIKYEAQLLSTSRSPLEIMVNIEDRITLCVHISVYDHIDKTFIVTINDITELVEIRRKMEKQALELKQSQKSLVEFRQFLERIIHDLRNKLAVVKLPLDILLSYWENSLFTTEDINNENKKTRIKKALVGSNDLGDMINELQTFLSTENAIIQSPKEYFNINELINSCIEEAQASLCALNKKPQCSVNFISNLTKGDIFLNKNLTRHIYVNLISNAIKFTPPNKRVFISLKVEGTRIIFKIVDEGIGIALDKMNQLFQPYVRDHRVLKDYPGSGLGLSMVKFCAEISNAEILVESTVDMGTTFTVITDL